VVFALNLQFELGVDVQVSVRNHFGSKCLRYYWSKFFEYGSISFVILSARLGSFASLLMLSHLINPFDYNRYISFIVWQQVILIVSTLGLEHQLFHQRSSDISLNIAMRFLLISAITLSIVFLVFMGFRAGAWHLQLIVCSISQGILFGIGIPLIRMKNRVNDFLKLAIRVSILAIVAKGYLFFSRNSELSTWISIDLMSMLVQLSFLFPLITNKASGDRVFRVNFRQSLVTILTLLAYFLGQQLFRVLGVLTLDVKEANQFFFVTLAGLTIAPLIFEFYKSSAFKLGNNELNKKFKGYTAIYFTVYISSVILILIALYIFLPREIIVLNLSTLLLILAGTLNFISSFLHLTLLSLSGTGSGPISPFLFSMFFAVSIYFLITQNNISIGILTFSSLMSCQALIASGYMLFYFKQFHSKSNFTLNS
jgi:hypothetical protein